MISFCDSNINYFSKEFNLDSNLKKLFNKEFNEIRDNISKLEYDFSLRGEIDADNLMKSIKNENLVRDSYISDLIHMSMNRLFDENQRFNEFKGYYLTRLYLNMIKYTKGTI